MALNAPCPRQWHCWCSGRLVNGADVLHRVLPLRAAAGRIRSACSACLGPDPIDSPAAARPPAAQWVKVCSRVQCKDWGLPSCPPVQSSIYSRLSLDPSGLPECQSFKFEHVFASHLPRNVISSYTAAALHDLYSWSCGELPVDGRIYIRIHLHVHHELEGRACRPGGKSTTPDLDIVCCFDHCNQERLCILFRYTEEHLWIIPNLRLSLRKEQVPVHPSIFLVFLTSHWTFKFLSFIQNVKSKYPSWQHQAIPGAS